MKKQQFWTHIDEARKQAGGWEEMAGPLINSLAELEIDDIVKWEQIFRQYQNLSYKNKLWAAAYVINGGCSDDGFDYFRAWLIAQGKEVFLAALYDPETLANDNRCEGEFEEFLGVAYEAYFKKFDADDDYDGFDEEMAKYPLSEMDKAEIAAEIKYADDMDKDWDEDDLKEWLPKLYEVFG